MAYAKTVSEVAQKRFNFLLATLKNTYHITQKRYALSVPCSAQTVTNAKRGHNNLALAGDFCKAAYDLTKGELDVSPQWLLGLDDFKNEKEREEFRLKTEAKRKEQEARIQEGFKERQTRRKSEKEVIKNLYDLLGSMGYEIISTYVLNWKKMLKNLPEAGDDFHDPTYDYEKYSSLKQWQEAEQPTQEQIIHTLLYISQSYTGIMYRLKTPSGAIREISHNDLMTVVCSIKNTVIALIDTGLLRADQKAEQYYWEWSLLEHDKLAITLSELPIDLNIF